MSGTPAGHERGLSPRMIAVAGNMGAGKSSLVHWLSRQFGAVPFFEPSEENPYLADFYADMPRWAMSSQIFFLVRRFQIHRELSRRVSHTAHPMVQDRTLYEDAEIFAAHLHRQGYIDDRDWRTYEDLYRMLRDEIRPPDLMIYLRCPLRTLLQRIRRRGREFERTVPRTYLASLDRLYEEWYARYDLSPTIVIETDRIDYVERLFDRLEVVKAIRKHIE